MPTRPALRFAPSPNGMLHLGHALSALTVDAWARRLGGRFLLRIEDYDTRRSRLEWVQGVFDDLAWLGLIWETPVLRQSEHTPVYAAAAQRLIDMGVLYRCYASRAEIAAAADAAKCDPDGGPLYPGRGRVLRAAEEAARRARGEPFALRLDMRRALDRARYKTNGAPLAFTELGPDGAPQRLPADPARWGDVLLVRKDAPASYHLAVVVDDARQSITHVTRGRDLFAATDLHCLLQVLLDLPAPLYHHHAVMTAPDGRKLAKSRGDTSLAALRAEGVTAADIRARLVIWAGS